MWFTQRSHWLIISCMNLIKAKELFFRYDGSQFYMSRDGVENDFLKLQIPKSMQAEWLGELTISKMKQLNSPGNWWVISFLIHHEDYRFFDQITSAKPLGKFWEKCAFLEDQFEYVKACRRKHKGHLYFKVFGSILEEARSLRKRVHPTILGDGPSRGFNLVGCTWCGGGSAVVP
jgi:hypothetical protein